MPRAKNMTQRARPLAIKKPQGESVWGGCSIFYVIYAKEEEEYKRKKIDNFFPPKNERNVWVALTGGSKTHRRLSSTVAAVQPTGFRHARYTLLAVSFFFFYTNELDHHYVW